MKYKLQTNPRWQLLYNSDMSDSTTTPQTPPRKAFLLTRNWRDTANGIELEFWAHSDDGSVRVLIEQQQAVCFVRRDSRINASGVTERKPLQLSTLQFEAVDGLYFQHQRDLNKLRDHLAHDKSLLLESEIKPNDRYLMERFITAAFEIHGEAHYRGVPGGQGFIEYINPQLRPTDYQPQLKWVSLDIETEDLRGKLYSIAVTTAGHEQVFMVRPAPADLNEHPNNILWCNNERQALLAFFDWLKQHDPDLIIGWNVVSFDLDFLQWKCQQLRLPFALGRGESSQSTASNNASILQPMQSGQMHIARIPGRVVLDGIAGLRSAFWSFESFTLEHVASELLNQHKLIQTASGQEKLDEIRALYRDDPLQLAAYNLQDCHLVSTIFDKTDLINFAIQRASMTGLAMDRHGGSTAAFDNLYLPKLHRQGFVAPDVGSSPNREHSPGGYVMESQPGLYHNVLVLDFKSLYPSIIRTFKIDPMGLALSSQEADAIPGFMQAGFSRDNHILPDLVTGLWHQRDLAKQHNNQPLSQAIKIIMNSFYGVLGSFGCRFFNPQLASSITRRGHEIIQTSKEVIEQQGYPVIYGDTDSVFVLLGEEHDETDCQRIGKALQDELNEWWQQELQQRFGLESCLEIEFETHYLRFLMPTIRGSDAGSKKRYAGLINKNGMRKMVFKGLETVRTDWTPLAREFQSALYERIFNDEPWREFVIDTHDRLLRGELDDKLVYTKRLRRPLDSYTSTQPPQVKAAHKMKKPGRRIQYVITLSGPEPIENNPSTPDYQHYLDKQLAPVADTLLYFLDTSFERITARQLDVFG